MMYQNVVFRRNGIEISEEDGCVCIQGKNGRVLLNITASLVWKYIDGSINGGTILENIVRLHMQDNPISHIENIFNESIALLLEYELIESVEQQK